MAIQILKIKEKWEPQGTIQFSKIGRTIVAAIHFTHVWRIFWRKILHLFAILRICLHLLRRLLAFVVAFVFGCRGICLRLLWRWLAIVEAFVSTCCWVCLQLLVRLRTFVQKHIRSVCKSMGTYMQKHVHETFVRNGTNCRIMSWEEHRIFAKHAKYAFVVADACVCVCIFSCICLHLSRHNVAELMSLTAQKRSNQSTSLEPAPYIRPQMSSKQGQMQRHMLDICCDICTEHMHKCREMQTRTFLYVSWKLEHLQGNENIHICRRRYTS